MLQGIQVGSVFEEQKVFDVIVRGTPATRTGVEGVRNMLIDTPSGGHVRLDQVADVRVVPSPSVIDREAVSRYVDIQAGVEGRSVEAVAADIEEQLAKLSFPIEYHAEVLTGGTGEEVGRGWVLGVAVAAAIAVLLLLQALFGSWRLAALVFVTLPLSLVGGLLTGLVDGVDLSLGSMLGFLAVLGLATRHNLVLVARLRSLEAEMPGISRRETIRRAASERLSPVTASALALAALGVPVRGPRVQAGTGDPAADGSGHPRWRGQLHPDGPVRRYRPCTCIWHRPFATTPPRWTETSALSVPEQTDHEQRLPAPASRVGQRDRLMSGARNAARQHERLDYWPASSASDCSLAGCKEVEEASATVHEPATVEEVAGLDVKRVTFDQAGADRVSLRTAAGAKDGPRNRRAVRRTDL